MITALDHIAIAVPDLERAIRRFMEDFGLPFAGSEDVVEAQTRTAFFPLPPTRIELVHPLDGQRRHRPLPREAPGRAASLVFSQRRPRRRRRAPEGTRL
jgi:methylmalonyl-CoA/ethylmalonyl-CoA epimerase